MANVSFEPGDGLFTVILDWDEAVPAEWNIPGAEIFRKTALGLATVKTPGEILGIGPVFVARLKEQNTDR